MHGRKLGAAVLAGACLGLAARGALLAQDPHAGMIMPGQTQPADHAMWQASLGGGWRVAGSAQLFPVLTFGAPTLEGSALNLAEAYLTQPAVMATLLAPGERAALRTTLNFEGITQADGEATFGAWGEGFIDKRHPHTLLHELVLSVNLWEARGGAASVFGGKGFAPFGSDDPMSRPGLKYPTNHHLSQILERWMLGAAYVRSGWGFEVAAFGGEEPDGPYDLSNIESFGDSWSSRVSYRFGLAPAGTPPWEVAVSHARVQEHRSDDVVTTSLWNGALRHESAVDSTATYALLEGSVARDNDGDDFFSVLLEGRLDRLGHQPYARVEYATRPEYIRGHSEAGEDFFRYEHDDAPIGSTRWLIGTVGYGHEMTRPPFSVRPFVEVQAFRVREGRGSVDPRLLFGSGGFWSVTVGARIYLWGDVMRMGAYGVLDPMTAMNREVTP